MHKSKNQNINIPNLLSIFRIILIPFFSFCLLDDDIDLAILLIVISGLSDAVDGFIARKFNQITELGKILDPFADKLTQIAIALCIGIKFPMLSPLLAIFLLKEIAMVIMASRLIHNLKKPCASKWYGKVGTVLFYLSATMIIGMYTLEVESVTFWTVAVIALSLTCAMMVYAAIKYFQIYREIVHSNERSNEFNLEEELKRKK